MSFLNAAATQSSALNDLATSGAVDPAMSTGLAIYFLVMLFCGIIIAFAPIIIAARRKTGRSGVCFLFCLVPIVGWPVALYLAVTSPNLEQVAAEKEAAEQLAAEKREAEERRHQQLLAIMGRGRA